jgi:hypothetical protein
VQPLTQWRWSYRRPTLRPSWQTWRGERVGGGWGMGAGRGVVERLGRKDEVDGRGYPALPPCP